MCIRDSISIARAIMKDAPIIILDEATANAVSYTHLDVYKRQGKYTAAEAKAFSAEQRQTLSLRTRDLAEITVPEKEPLPKTAPTALAVSDVCYTSVSYTHLDVYKRQLIPSSSASSCRRPVDFSALLFGKKN